MKRSLVVPVLLLLSLSAFAQRRRTTMPVLPTGAARVSEEYPVADIAYGPTYGANFAPRVASGPDQSLVVWASKTGTQAARIDRAGTLLDVPPLDWTADSVAGVPDVVWDGSRYLLAVPSSSGDALRLVAVDSDGRLERNIELDHFPYVVNAFAMVRHTSGELAVAYVMRDDRGSVGVTILSSGGSLIRKLNLGTSVPQTRSVSVRIASSPEGYLAVWDGGAATISLHGSSSTVLTLAGGRADAVWNGSDYLIVRAENAIDGTHTVRGEHVSTAGALSQPFVIRSAPHIVDAPAIVWNSGEYAVAWKEVQTEEWLGSRFSRSYDLRTARVSADGTVLESQRLDALTDIETTWYGRTDTPAISTRGGRNLYVWTRSHSSGGTIGLDPPRDLYAVWTEGGRLPPDETGDEVQRISSVAVSEGALAVAASGGEARAFWTERSDASSSGPYTTVTSAVDAHGRRSSVKTVPAQQSGSLVYFARTTGGTVAVSRESAPSSAPFGIIESFVDPDGNSTAPVALVKPEGGININVSPLGLACGASECGLVYTFVDSDVPSQSKQYLQRFTPSGALIGPPIDVPTGFQGISAAAGQYLLLFKWPMQDHNLVVSRFADGKLSDITTLLPQTDTYNSAIASNGKEWLVLCERAQGVLAAFRVDAAGNLLTQTDITLPPNTAAGQLSATWDGKNWIVAWLPPGGIYAARLAADGTLIDASPSGDGFGVAATVDRGYQFSIDSAGDGLTAVGYTRATTERQYGQTSRVFVRWIDNR